MKRKNERKKLKVRINDEDEAQSHGYSTENEITVEAAEGVQPGKLQQLYGFYRSQSKHSRQSEQGAQLNKRVPRDDRTELER